MATPRKTSTRVRYAVVGLGHIAQAAVLPAFAHARRNSELAALVSDDARKMRELARRYRVPATYTYEQFAEAAEEKAFDAVYICLPNHLHRDWVLAAARAGIHVLCEKPLAVTARDAERMVEATEKAGVLLMTAYRLHFERANLSAIELVRSRKLGEPRFYVSGFSMDVRAGNVRLEAEENGGGPLYDIGVYCLNAVRHLFRAEPEEVFAARASRKEARFQKSPEMVAATLRFPGDRLASFTCSFGAADTGWYHVVGTKGDVRVDPAFEYAEGLGWRAKIGDRTMTRRYGKRDQFGPEILHFSDRVRSRKTPGPSGREGLADVRVVEALRESADSGRAVKLPPFEVSKRPTLAQENRQPPVPKPELVGDAASASR
ncbi:MAG TPA: Gfo/Idh/MocA family oxidoreductase [Thermoanaerobaculia bacterium]|jgi:glucose-fructose oxidoreductase